MIRIYILLALICLISCKNTPEQTDNLGVVRLQVSGADNAKVAFEKGLLLLHSFEYEDAREAFKQAQSLDREMPMAYWGEAMTYNHPLWSEQDYEDGTHALSRLNTFDYKSKCNQLEMDLITGVQILYKPKSPKADRDIAYSSYMENLNNKYPDDQEVAAFYALSLLATAVSNRDQEVFGKGAKIAQGILEENPEHPGALHYLIHSYDDPDHAPLALNAARSYSQVAPDASHALHMPSHIFVAMGMWDDVIASNVDSYQASLNRMEAKNLGNDARGYHAYHWLQYGYLQKNQQDKANKMVWELDQFVKETPSVRGRTHMVFLKGTYLVETNAWNDSIANIPVDLADLNISIVSQYHFLEGMKAYNNKNLTALDSIIALKETNYRRGRFVATNGAAKLCSGATRGDVTNADVNEVEVRMDQLKALRANLDGDLALADALFKKAIELEEALSYSYGPPIIQKPSRELYADWLATQNRMEEANAQYALALKRGPSRRYPTIGLERTQGTL